MKFENGRIDEDDDDKAIISIFFCFHLCFSTVLLYIGPFFTGQKIMRASRFYYWAYGPVYESPSLC